MPDDTRGSRDKKREREVGAATNPSEDDHVSKYTQTKTIQMAVKKKKLLHSPVGEDTC